MSQRSLAEESTDGSYEVVAGSRHNIQVEQPQAVIDCGRVGAQRSDAGLNGASNRRHRGRSGTACSAVTVAGGSWHPWYVDGSLLACEDPTMTRLLHPRYWGYHLVVVVALVAAGLLGLWQYHGWQERRAAEARDLTQVAPIPLADAIGPDDPFPGEYVGQPVEVVGTWVPGSTVYVSGREHEGREGYWVVDAVRVGVVAAARRARVVAVTGRRTGAGGRRQPGRLAPAVRGCRHRRRPDRRRAPAAAGGRPRAALRRGPVRRVRRRAASPRDGLVAADLQQLPEAGRFTAIRNLLYAIEWWFFGAFAAVRLVAVGAGAPPSRPSDGASAALGRVVRT